MKDIIPQVRALAVQLRNASDSHMARVRTLKPTFAVDEMERTSLKLLADRCQRTAEKLEEIINERKCLLLTGACDSVHQCNNCILNRHFAQCATETR